MAGSDGGPGALAHRGGGRLVRVPRGDPEPTELLGVLGAGFGFRAMAREALDVVPVAGWLVKGLVAYAGTRALGEAARRYFEARTARAAAA